MVPLTGIYEMLSSKAHNVLTTIAQLFPIAITNRRLHFSYTIPLIRQNAIAKLSNNQLQQLILIPIVCFILPQALCQVGYLNIARLITRT